MAGKRIVVFSLFGLVALALTVFASSGTQAGTYKVLLAYSLSDYTAGATANTLNDIKIPVPDLNYEDSSMLTFNPIDPSSVMGLAIPIGAGVGLLAATSTVGISNGACNSGLLPNFTLYNASVVTTGAGVLEPADLYWVLKDKTKFPVPKGKWDTNLEDYLEGYPGFLNEMFDPDGAGPLPPLKPRSRYAGHAFVANMNILIQVVTFSPGQMAQLPGIYQQLGAAIGRPSLVILNNPISQEEAPGAISDFCTPLVTTTTTYGVSTDNPATPANEAGYTIQSNPAADKGVLGSGTHIARNYSRSERDADGDGIENDLDPCPYTDDTGWDPRVDGGPGTGDNDNDGLPDSCDPNDNDNNIDQDGDGYDNRQDICPLVINGCKTSTCHPFTFNPIWDNQADDDSAVLSADLGPNPDSIGNACDDSDEDGNEDGCGAGTCNDGLDNKAGACDGTGTDGVDGNDDDCKPYMDKAEVGECRNSTDDDPVNDGQPYGTYINDGCPVKGTAETDCGPNETLPLDDDADTRVNDGCITRGTTAEVAGTTNDADIWGTNPGTGEFFHAMPLAAVCVGGTDSDGDGYCDTLETSLGSPTDDGPEYTLVKATVCGGALANCCDNDDDDDSDGYVNDGCPMAGKNVESDAECANDTSDDTPTPDAQEQLQGVKVNDGCPVIGVPESLVLDVAVTAGDAQPSNAVPQTCSDGIDNDGDTTIDTDAETLGCDPTNTSYDNDPDHDGYADNPDDICPGLWNPDQTNTDGDALGDACDPNDDNDAYSDLREWLGGSDPLKAPTPGTCNGVNDVADGWPDPDNDGWGDLCDNCPDNTNPTQANFDTHNKGDACDADDDDDGWEDSEEIAAGSDPLFKTKTPEVCDGVDNDQDGSTDEGFPDFNNDGEKDCVEDEADQCTAPHPNCDWDGDTVLNGPDIDADDGFGVENDHFLDSEEIYMGTNPIGKCTTGTPPRPDWDPYDTDKTGTAIGVLDLFVFVNQQALGGKISDDNAGGQYKHRLDLNQAGAQKGSISVLDLFVYVNKGVLGLKCAVGY
jgi:hypothetical protein